MQDGSAPGWPLMKHFGIPFTVLRLQHISFQGLLDPISIGVLLIQSSTQKQGLEPKVASLLSVSC